MLREIQQVLRLIMCLKKQKHGLKTTGGLLVLMWTDTEASGQTLNCSVAAAGPWCAGIHMKDLQRVLPDLEESVFHCEWTYLEPDPEELCTFTELYGSLRLLLSIQIKDTSLFSPEWCAHTEAFLHTFSLANAGIKIHLKLKLSQQTVQHEFRGKVKKRVARGNQPSPVLDVTCRTQPPVCVKKGCWCLGGHPVCGSQIPLSIHPDAMDQGLFGELSLQPVTLLSPCVLQYPHLTTQLTQIKISFVDLCGKNSELQPAECESSGEGQHLKSMVMGHSWKTVDYSLRTGAVLVPQVTESRYPLVLMTVESKAWPC
ncbi:DUF4554 domain-containing protein [Labrus bergylta]|uniref:DUF4554 domain-containing protein n=1 Tax=Labrus bergylta TaxID=56723 RepID=UPI003313C40D